MPQMQHDIILMYHVVVTAWYSKNMLCAILCPEVHQYVKKAAGGLSTYLKQISSLPQMQLLRH